VIWRRLAQARWNCRALASAGGNQDAPAFYFGAGKRLVAEPRQRRGRASEYRRKTKAPFKLLGR
jgi:hypothetical protein